MNPNFYAKPGPQDRSQVLDQVYIKDDIPLMEESKRESITKGTIVSLTDESAHNLPRLVPYEEYSKHMLISIPPEIDSKVSAAIQNLMEKMGENLIIFDKIESKKFVFSLPPTIFDEKWSNASLIKQRNDDDIEDAHILNENSKLSRLSFKQLGQIWKTGSFSSPSMISNKEYTWKVSAWIMNGRKKITGIFFDLYAFGINQFYEFPRRIYSNKHRLQFCLPDIYHGFHSIYRFLLNLFSMFIGYPKYLKINPNKNVVRQKMLMRHMNDIINNNEIDKEFYNFVNHNNNKVLLRDIENEFTEIWKKKKDSIANQMAEDEDFFINLQEIYYENLYEFILLTNRLPENIKPLLINHVKIARIIANSYDINKDNMEKKNMEFIKNLKQNHTLLKRVNDWIENKINSFTNESKLEYRSNIFKNVSDEFEKNQNEFHSFKILFEKFFNFLTTFKKNFNLEMKEELMSLKEIKESYVPYRTITLYKYHYPPGKTIKLNNQYHLQEYSEHSIKTNHYFWRFSIMILRYFIWSHNASLFLFWNTFSGYFSLKVLFYKNAFYAHYEVDQYTGEKINFSQKIETVYSTFQNIMNSISKSRKDFESSPDTGIFGKKFTRICNLAENYIFKFFCLGIILVIILFPLVILINCIFSFILAITAYIWMIFVIIFVWIVNILFFDIDNEGNPENNAENSAFELPLIFEIFVTFIVFGIFQICLAITFLLLIHPAIIIITFILGIIYYILSTFYDILLMMVIFTLGREPKTDSILAWKISGPGISEDYYNQIEMDEIFILVRVFLEKYELSLFQKKMVKLINDPCEKVNLLHVYVFEKTFKTGIPKKPKEIVELTQLLLDKLKAQISSRAKFYPKYPKNIRLTEDELQESLLNSEKLINEFITKQNLKEIFVDCKLKKNDWKNLTRSIFVNIFGKGILEPIEDLEKRAVLKPFKSGNFENILDILKGGSGDTYKNLVLKKKKKVIDYKYTPSYFKIDHLLSHDNYFGSFVNCLYIYTNLEEIINKTLIKDDDKI